MNNIFKNLIRFIYLMQSPLLAHGNFLRLILAKHGVNFLKYAFFNFRAKNYIAYIYERREYFGEKIPSTQISCYNSLIL
jgi:hypothetical protein